MVIVLNDIDVLVLLLRYMSILHSKGLEILWVRFGNGEKLFINLCKFFTKLGLGVCSIIVKYHILCVGDVLNKDGTKPAATRAQPLKSSEQFAEIDSL